MNTWLKKLVLLAGLGLMMTGSLFAQAGSFNSQAWYFVGESSKNVVAADVTGDGKPDLISARNGDDGLQINVLVNKGNGTYNTRKIYEMGNYGVDRIAVGDVNGDGKQDIVAAGSSNEKIHIMLNNGSGGFSSVTSFDGDGTIFNIFLANIDGDSDLDIITGNHQYSPEGDSYSVFFNNGSGNFSSRTDYPVSDFINSIQVANIDGDSDNDLILGYEYGTKISVAKNNGSGVFGALSDFNGGSSLYTIKAVNLDGDSDIDVVASDLDNNYPQIFTNNGTGSFTASNGPSLGGTQLDILTADVDGDGDQDLIGGTSGVSVAKNNGNGTFAAVTTYTGIMEPSYWGTTTDVDSDGDQDVIFIGTKGDVGKDVVIVALNNQSVPPTVSSHTPTFYASDVSASTNVTVTFSRDMNSTTLTNSTIRLVGSLTGQHSGTLTYNSGSKTVTIDPTTNFKPGEVVTVMVNTGVQTSDGAYISKGYQFYFTVESANSTGILAAKTDYTTGTKPNYVATGDLDGDGDLDLAITNLEAATVSVLLNTGSGSFSAKTDYTTGDHPSAITMADIDWDGDLDLVISNYWDKTISLLKNNGNGTFSAKSDVSDATSAGHAVADFNGDGYLDIMTNSDNSGILKLNNGSGVFSVGEDLATSVGDYNFVAGDQNRDGIPDGFYTNSRGSSYYSALNNSDATFSSSYFDLYDLSSTGLVAADFNNDGRVDVAKVDDYYNKIMVSLNSNNYLNASVDYSIGAGGEGVTAADIDGDGDLDFIVALGDVDSIAVLKNNGSGVFGARTSYPAGDNPQYVAYGDFDGDGDVDFVVTNMDANTISVYLNGTPPPTVASVSPVKNAINISSSSSIGITFDKAMDGSTINTNSILVSSQFKGKYTGTVTYDSGSKTATFDPSSDFKAGEVVSVTVTTAAKSSDGTAMLKPFSSSFTAGSVFGGTFGTSTNFSLGVNPGYLVSADFDKDGDLDMGVVNYGDNNVSVLLNSGSGSFAARVNYATGTGPIGLSTVDVNSDGAPDLIAANFSAASISVFINNGSGVFSAKTDYSTGTNPIVTSSADFDGDGDLDLAVTNQGSANVSIFMNNGNGTFATKIDYATGTTPVGNKAGDVNNDGFPDLVIANFGNSSASVLLNNGNGTFAARVNYTVGTNPQNLTIGDLDADGDLDIVTANWTSNNFSVLKNNGSGVYGTKTDYTTGTNPLVPVVADIDADGDLDVLVSNFSSNNVSVYLNSGTGTYSGKTDYAVGTVPYGFTAADVDGNGSIDMMAANNTSNNITVWFNAVKPNVVSVTPSKNALNIAPDSSISITFDQAMNAATMTIGNIKVSGSITGFHSGTINYDSGAKKATYYLTEPFTYGEVVTLTVTTGVKNTNNVALKNPFSSSYVVDADSAGTFASAVSSEAGTYTSAITSADLNGDHYPDLVTANYLGNSLSVFLNNGNGTMGAKTDLGVGTYPWGVHATDVDGDGDLDLISANSTSSNLSQFKNNGDGTFAAKTDISTGNSPWGVTSSDVDGDGDMDLITGNYYEHTIGVLKNNGNGTYAAMVTYPSGQKPFNMVMADVDSDGDQDIIASTWDSNSLTVLKNNGDGTFAAKLEYGVGGKPRGLSAVDLNGDGKIDLVTAYNNPDYQISVLIGNGDGTYASAVTYGTAAKPDGLATADVDGDGDMDVIVACSDANNVYILKNAGNGTFGNGAAKGTGGAPSDVVAADFDRDGSIDLASSNLSGNSISVIMNNSGTNASGGTYSNVNITSPTTLSGDLEVSGTLNVSSQITTGGNSINLGTTGSLTGETPSNYIVGTIEATRNISAQQNNIGGLGISIDPQSNNMGSTVIRRETGTPAGNSTSIKQVWTITPENQPSGPVTVTLSWPSTNDNSANLANLVLFKSEDNKVSWNVTDAVFNTGTDPRTVTFTVSSFSAFTVGENNALPVELVSFTASGSKLEWKTATETNNSGWEIESRILESGDRNQNGGWKKIGFVAGKGTTTEKQNYSFEIAHSEFKSSVLLVRLKQIDTDGKITYSKVLTINRIPDSFSLSQNYPNPFNPSTKISYDLPSASQVTLKIYDLLGREVRSLVNQEKPAGTYTVEFSAIDLPSGFYFYKLTAGEFTSTKKMMLMK